MGGGRPPGYVELRPIVLVAETPSLATSLAGLLEAEGYRVIPVPDARSAQHVLTRPTESEGVLVAVSNSYASETTRAWQEGSYGDRPLVLVGGRDPMLRTDGRLFIVRLPIRFDELLGTIRQLATPAGPPDAAGPLGPLD